MLTLTAFCLHFLIHFCYRMVLLMLGIWKRSKYFLNHINSIFWTNILGISRALLLVHWDFSAIWPAQCCEKRPVSRPCIGDRTVIVLFRRFATEKVKYTKTRDGLTACATKIPLSGKVFISVEMFTRLKNIAYVIQKFPQCWNKRVLEAVIVISRRK